jgi:hypothetical protein
VDQIVFKEDTHEYFVAGKRIPSVTEILDKVLFLPQQNIYTEESTLRGKAVHLACQFYDEKCLNEESIDPKIKPYFEAYKSFLNDYRPEWVEIEKRYYNKTYGYCGTIDRLGKCFKQLILTDLKSGMIKEKTEFQLNAYLRTNEEMFKNVDKISALHLMNTGKYKMIPCDISAKKFNEFLSALNVYKFWGGL